jgi:hypothetical protein
MTSARWWLPVLALAAFLSAPQALAGDIREAAPDADPLPCAQGASSIEALCACLATRAETLLLHGGEREIECKPGAALAHGSERLSVLLWGSDGTGERIHLLIAHDGPVFRPVADLGHDFEPGAFGVHQEAKVESSQARTVAGRTVVVVRSEEVNNDFDLAGLALSVYSRRLDTLCAVGGPDESTRCTSIPVLIRSSYGVGIELDPKQIGDHTRQDLKKIRADSHDERTKLRYRIERDGRVRVSHAGGSRRLVPAGALRTRRLFASERPQ